ncbi:gamma carbonic anhydrase family protein [Tuberibacillus sp. Marseille-P3662]|uniref:gamma carbonic anhydrase family protein n=1 Tax=Tuberibacillus sp. Marseille-P3662 TaxID=1965358 RepID=UPI000A1C9462|nr:gamma carbonic anhydrase family protein [Tuberibacillus sp. Marseille-P3662]
MIYSYNEKEPHIHSSAYIAPGAHIIGDVVMEDNTTVWFNAVLRGDHERITIGKGSNVQDGTVVHVDEGYPLTIGRQATIGHNVTLHGCEVKDGALIGMGATVLNGAVIGEGALVAAGALVPEGKVIEPGMLAAGVPARAVRRLSDENIERIAKGAQIYIDSGQHYKQEGIIDPSLQDD